MNKLEKLIAKLCPNGVEYKALGDVLFSIRTGLNPRQNFVLNEVGATNYYVTVKEFSSGKLEFSEKTDRITNDALKIIQGRSHLEIGDVLLSGIGTIGRVTVVDIPTENFNCSESVYLLKPNPGFVGSRFLGYVLNTQGVQSQWEKTSVGSTLKGIRKETLMKVLIPIPPLPVQEEIVRMLDDMAGLIGELEQELAVRKQQYEWYRERLLTEKAGKYKSKKLGEIATIERGNGLAKKDFVESGFPCIHYGQLYTQFNTYAVQAKTFVSKEFAIELKHLHHGDVLMAVTSENIEDVCKCIAWLGEGDVVVGGHTAIIRHQVNPKYLAYWFQTDVFFHQKRILAHGTKVIEVTPSCLNEVLLPVPPIPVQEEIVRMLDDMAGLIGELEQEISARKQQYEYYRDKLLTFPRAD